MGNSHPSPITNKAMLEKDGAFELSLSADQIAADTLALARIPATLTGKDADTLDSIDSTDFIHSLTVAEFQGNAGTGTAAEPQAINDGEITDSTSFDDIGEYCDVDFGFIRLLTQYRRHASIIGQGDPDNLCKIQHWNGLEWVDNTVDLPPPNRVSEWSEWTALTIPVLTSKIRYVMTAKGGTFAYHLIRELEMKGI